MRKPIGKIKSENEQKRMRRKLSIRKKVSGSKERPRICVIKTNKHLSAQIIDDTEDKVLFSLGTYGKKMGLEGIKKSNEGAKTLGSKLAEKLKSQGIKSAVVDRSGRRYHGVIKNLADGVREGGIQI